MGITTRVGKGVPLTHEELDANFAACMGLHNLLHVQDQKVVDVQGGTFTSGAWRTRTLNTVVSNTITGASLANNQITLPSGVYYVEAVAPARGVDMHQARLQNITEGTTIIIGLQENAANTNGISSRSFVCGKFELNSTSALELQHGCYTTYVDVGFGTRASSITGATISIYSDIKIWKLS